MAKTPFENIIATKTLGHVTKPRETKLFRLFLKKQLKSGR